MEKPHPVPVKDVIPPLTILGDSLRLLVIVLSLLASPTFAAPRCAETHTRFLKSGIPQQPQFVASVLEIAQSWQNQVSQQTRGQSTKVVDENRIQIPINSTVRETLSYMQKWLKLGKKNVAITPMASQVAERLSVLISSYDGKEQIGLPVYQKMGLIFSQVISPLIDKYEITDGRHGQHLFEIRQLLYGQYQKKLDQRSAFGFLFPTKRFLGFTSILDAHAAGLHFMGLTEKTHLIDGGPLSPEFYTAHDIQHAEGLLHAEWISREKGQFWRSFLFPKKIYSVRKRMAFRAELKAFAFRPGRTTDEAKLFETIYFDVFHERERPIHPATLNWDLNKYFAGEAKIAHSLLERLHDDSDFGQAFTVKPTIQDLLKARDEILQMLRQKYADDLELRNNSEDQIDDFSQDEF